RSATQSFLDATNRLGVKDRRTVIQCKPIRSRLSFAGDGLPNRCFMATPTRKGSKNKKAKLRRSMVNTSVDEQPQTIAELRQQVATLSQDQETTAKELQDCRR